MYKHILIATDGSELAGKGVDHGMALAQKVGAKVTVLSVAEPLQASAVELAVAGGLKDPFGHYDQQIDQKMKDLYEPIKRQAEDLGLTVNLLHEIDQSPAEAIVRTADLGGCDLIVMASHGRRGIKKLLLGSQTSEVLVTTTIPVLVIK